MSAPDDRPPESGDASHFDFDDLVLDEDFVRAATINEATATARVERKREQQVRRSHRFPRPLLRRIRLRLRQGSTRPRPDDRRTKPAPEAPRLAEWTSAQWAVAVVALVLAGAFVWLLSGSHSGAHSAASTAVPTAVTPAGDDAVGTCRGTQSPANPAGATVVPCSGPHLVQVTGYATIPSSIQSEPSTDATWQYLVSDSCQQSAVDYAGAALQSGFQSGYIPPTSQQWSAGNHTVECTVYKPDNAGRQTPFTGSLRT